MLFFVADSLRIGFLWKNNLWKFNILVHLRYIELFDQLTTNKINYYNILVCKTYTMAFKNLNTGFGASRVAVTVIVTAAVVIVVVF